MATVDPGRLSLHAGTLRQVARFDEKAALARRAGFGAWALRGVELEGYLAEEADGRRSIDDVRRLNAALGLTISETGSLMHATGSVNVSKFGSKLPGCGGFIDISQNAKRVVFCGLFGKAGDTRLQAGRLEVVGRGRITKFRNRVEHVTFSGPRAAAAGKPVLYVTERAVFGLGPGGVELREIAPGLDAERDVLAAMEFRPAIAPDLRTMDARIFDPGPLGLRGRWHG